MSDATQPLDAEGASLDFADENVRQAAFSWLMDKAAGGIEAAVRAYVAGDLTEATKRLDAVDCGVSLLREWIAE